MLNLDQAQLTKLAIAGGILYAAYRFAPNATMKTAVLGLAGVVVAKQVPVLNEYI